MQFTCESCKTVLQIADEKVRGKRLVVRCKRCGARITISDPALAARLPAGSAPKAAPAPSGSAPRPAPAPPPQTPAPSAPPKAAEPEPERDTDTESTRAMDSDLLEKALQASKRDDAAPAPAAPAPAAPVPVAPAPAAPPRDPPIWFAMIGGKQTGPMSRAEIGLKTAQAIIGPRTYLWKDGMGAWQRAKDVAELSSMFGPPPGPSVPPPPPAAPVDPSAITNPGVARPSADPSAATNPGVVRPAALPQPGWDPKPAAAAPEPKPAPEPRSAPEKPAAQQKPAASLSEEHEEPTSVDPLPLGERVHQEAVAKELFTSGESTPPQSALDLARWASDELARKRETNPQIQRADLPPPVSSRPPTGPILLGQSEKRPKTTLWIAIVLALLAITAVVIYSTMAGGAPEHAEAAAPPPTPATQQAAAAPVEAAKAAEPPAAQPASPPAKEPQPAGLTSDQVRKKLDEHKGSLQGCIDEALKREPNLRVGKIHIATTIAPTGSVTAAKIDKRTVDESPLGACLKKATKRIAFPSFRGDSFDVDIPIVVTAGE